MLIKDLRDKNDISPSLLNIIIVGQDFSSEEGTVEYHHPGYEQPPYHLLINVISNKAYDTFQLLFTYPAGMYEDKDLKIMYGHLTNILKDAVEKPDRKIGETQAHFR